MNLANKITTSRMVLSIIIIVILLFPFYDVGVDVPTYLVNGNIVVDLRYIVAGVLFIIASLTDFLDGHIARKYNMVTDYGKMMDAITDKLLVNSVLIILACNGMVSPVIAVVVIIRDFIVDSAKMVVGNKGKAVAAIPIAKVKTALLMVGLTLTFFYNLPFELFNFGLSDLLLIIASVLAVVSGVKYYNMAMKIVK